jgi:hypothetical protein
MVPCFRSGGAVYLLLRGAGSFALNAGVIEYRTYDDMKEAIRMLHDTELRGSYVKLREVKLTSPALYYYTHIPCQLQSCP